MQIMQQSEGSSSQSIILVSHNAIDTKTFVDKFITDRKIKAYNVFYIDPLAKEFSIAQIRAVKKEVIYSSAEPRLYVLTSFDTASYEAQNAFLKTLEQPPNGVWFILVVANPHVLLPTIRSRAAVHIVAARTPEAAHKSLGAALTALVEKGDLSVLAGSALNAKSHADPILLFDEIIRFFRSRLATDSKSPRILRSVLTVRSYMLTNHVDAQNCIDQLAITIHKMNAPIS